MSFLNYIDDDTILDHVKSVLDAGINRKAETEKNFGKNVIDPFATIFDAAVSDVDHETWKKSEVVRQCQKTLTNHIGDLHQKILGSVEGWDNLGVGNEFDLICESRQILAEIKNKFNTVSFGKLSGHYYEFENLITPKASRFKGYTAYFVNIIPKKPQRYDIPFTPSDKSKGMRCVLNEKIREIDGASFYHLVTGSESALEDLYDALPSVIEQVFAEEYDKPLSIPDKELFKQYFDTAYK